MEKEIREIWLSGKQAKLLFDSVIHTMDEKNNRVDKVGLEVKNGQLYLTTICGYTGTITNVSTLTDNGFKVAIKPLKINKNDSSVTISYDSDNIYIDIDGTKTEYKNETDRDNTLFMALNNLFTEEHMPDNSALLDIRLLKKIIKGLPNEDIEICVDEKKGLFLKQIIDIENQNEITINKILLPKRRVR